jgi:hypothetical protein
VPEPVEEERNIGFRNSADAKRISRENQQAPACEIVGVAVERDIISLEP